MVPETGLVLALGGGTARAMSHVGFIRALHERGIEPAGMAGTSFGAIVAALWALDTPPDQMERLLTQPAARHVWAQGMDFGLGSFSLIRGRRLEKWLDQLLYRGATFADASKPLVIATTNLSDGGLHLVNEGSLARAVVASCSLPLLFAPVRLGELWSVDGGFVEAVPFQAGASLGYRYLLGINTGIDTDRAAMVRWIRTLRRQRWARAVADWGISRSERHAAGRVLRGLGWAAHSYGRPQPMPEGAALLRIDPGIAWWDFHRTAFAVNAGLQVGRAALDGGLLDTLVPIGPVPGEVNP